MPLEEKLTGCWLDFTAHMGARLLEKQEAGYTGWDDEKSVSTYSVLLSLLKNLVDGDYVDVANWAMFLWCRSGRKPK